MNRLLIVLWVVLLVQVQPGCVGAAGPDREGFCSQEWYLFIEERGVTGVGLGHGPDIGSDAWRSAVEFKLGIRGKAKVPQRNSDTWCRYIDQKVQSSRMGKKEDGHIYHSAKARAPLICSTT